LAEAQKVLSNEKSARSDVAKALAEEKTARLAAKQALKDDNKAKSKVAKALETTQVVYTVTQDKLTSKSKELDDMTIREQKADMLWVQAEKKLADAGKALATADEEKKNQRLLSESARQALSNCEDSSIQMISTTLANAMALLKSHLPDLDVELLRMDFAVDEVEREALTNSAYDATHEFASSYDFSSFAESKDNDSLRNV
jgi:chromosome segregation ATPase